MIESQLPFIKPIVDKESNQVKTSKTDETQPCMNDGNIDWCNSAKNVSFNSHDIVQENLILIK